MPKKAKKTTKKPAKRVAKANRTKKTQGDKLPMTVYTQVNQLKKKLDESTKKVSFLQEHVEDSAIHINLLTRLITTLCVEKMGMRVGVLKRLLKRIEKEAIRDSQIVHLESLYKMSEESSKKSSSPRKSPKSDPWDEIS